LSSATTSPAWRTGTQSPSDAGHGLMGRDRCRRSDLPATRAPRPARRRRCRPRDRSLAHGGGRDEVTASQTNRPARDRCGSAPRASTIAAMASVIRCSIGRSSRSSVARAIAASSSSWCARLASLPARGRSAARAAPCQPLALPPELTGVDVDSPRPALLQPQRHASQPTNFGLLTSSPPTRPAGSWFCRYHSSTTSYGRGPRAARLPRPGLAEHGAWDEGREARGRHRHRAVSSRRFDGAGDGRAPGGRRRHMAAGSP
jgi:hypothetical protein